MYAGALLLGIFLSVSASAQPRVTECVSVGTGGGQLDGHSAGPVASANGRYIAFLSEATSLDGCIGTPGIGQLWGSGLAHVYLRDRQAGTTECISRASDETPGNGRSEAGGVSSDGRFVVFTSRSSNFVTPATTTSRVHVYVRDRTNGTTQLVSVAPDGVTEADLDSESPKISDNGRFVVFEGPVELLPHHPYVGSSNYVRDLVAGTTRDIDILPAPPRRSASFLTYGISDDGRFVLGSALEYSTNRADPFVYVADMARREMTLISVAKDGTVPRRLSTPVGMSGDGKVVLFDSNSDTLLVPDANGTRSDTYRSTRVPLPPPG